MNESIIPSMGYIFSCAFMCLLGILFQIHKFLFFLRCFFLSLSMQTKENWIWVIYVHKVSVYEYVTNRIICYINWNSTPTSTGTKSDNVWIKSKHIMVNQTLHFSLQRRLDEGYNLCIVTYNSIMLWKIENKTANKNMSIIIFQFKPAFLASSILVGRIKLQT